MTREEEIRQEMSKIAGTHPDWNKNDCMRMGFYEGAKWADRTMIDKGREWLQCIDFEVEYFTTDNDGYTFFNDDKFIEDFCKTMEE